MPSTSVRIDHIHSQELSISNAFVVDTGANASAEDGEEALDDAAQKVNNIIHSFRLQPTSFDKASYLAYLKGKTDIPSFDSVAK